MKELHFWIARFFIMGDYKHGLSRHPLYQRWWHMKSRCYNPKDKDFKNYGDRGIEVYGPWLNNVGLYIEYVMTLPGWNNPELTIDRIENDCNYQPMNLRFVNRHLQNANRRNKTGYTGVNKVRNKYVAVIELHKNSIYIGTRDTPQEAVMVRNEFILNNNLPEYKIQKIQ